MIRMFIPWIRIVLPSRILDPGVKKAPDLGSGSATLVSSSSLLTCRRVAEAQSAVTEAPPPPVVVDRSPEVEALQKKVDNLNRLLEGKVNEVVEVHKQLNVRITV
jgi:hypothetical protein